MLSHFGNPLLARANGHQTSYPTDRTILQLFEMQAAAAPDRPAVTYGGRTLSYTELDRHAVGLADRLRGCGVAKGHFVPLIMDGGMALPVAMIATMKIGAPFIPVDQGWPRERVRAIIDKLQPMVMLTSGPAEPWSELGPAALHADLDQLPVEASADLEQPATVADLIYGFFTSGSTGTPKCTVNRHLGLLNRFIYMTGRFGGGEHVVLQNSQHVFDSAIWQLLWPLTNGSQVIIPERDGILDLVRTIDVIARHGVTMTDFVPSIFNTLVEMLTTNPRLVRRLSSLRQILIGGEEVSPAAVHTLSGLLPGIRITNTYGPTEASIGSLFHEITAADSQAIPIGLPIDNTYAAIVNEQSELVRPGEIGEIYIGGDCLGIGYLGDPGKTASAFVPNPFPQIPGTLLYRTGDLGYQRDDGLFMFVGRADQQVKVGGVRIELSEVESVLAAHPAVRDAKVIVHGAGAARTLVGFVVARTDATPEALSKHARDLLPCHSVPRRIVLLDHLPLTQNGKADRHELARMARRLAGGTDTGAVSPAEAAVKDVWLELLSRDDVGTRESFFDSGGDSLAAQRLALALERRLGVRLTIHDIVGAPTVRAQAALIAGTPGVAAPGAGEVAEALRRDVRLDLGIARLGGGATAPGMGRVLLTGATGFVGVHLLDELVTRAHCTVYCLVRGGSAEESRDRLIAALERHALAAQAIMRHVLMVPCDLKLPYFGLGPGEFADLAESVDTVIHNAALVNLVLDYASHRGANVMGTAEILRLAALGAPKRLHYVSTLSVFPVPGEAAGSRGEPVAGEHETSDLAVPSDGYSQSKWVAEKIVALARARGMPATVYRLGEVMPHSRTGIANPRSVLDNLMRACARLGLRFATQAVTDWTPVDKVSEFIVGAARSSRDLAEYLHVFRPPGIRIEHVLDALGGVVPLREVSYAEFWTTLGKIVEQDADRQLAGLLSVLPDPRGQPFPEHLTGVFSDAATLFSAELAARLSDDLGISWSGADEAAVRAYLSPGAGGRERWLRDSGRQVIER
jgi:amino acid adenylation domain-containing protein/thioester reductase-like protein